MVESSGLLAEEAGEGHRFGGGGPLRKVHPDHSEDALTLPLRAGSAHPTTSPAYERERLHADAALASAAARAYGDSASAAPRAFGLDPRLRAADLNATARALDRRSRAEEVIVIRRSARAPS